MKPITQLADEIGIDAAHVSPQGRYKAKLRLEAIKDNPKGKLVLMTGMTPTRAGEGKTTTTVGLTQAMGRLGHNAAATLREPSLGPIFGIKGGGTGGGKALVEPQSEVNIHFTGDAHAVASAHNLLAALTDNAADRGQIPGFTAADITWRRVVDVEERALRQIVTGLGGSTNGPIRESGFDIVTASEIMAILALSSSLEDLRSRLSRVVVGFTEEDKPVTADDVGAVGSLMALLRLAIRPNMVQTTEGQPVFVHAGPFGNIAHGCNSVLADRVALSYSDYVFTEAGFGADLGFEKFMHIKARFNDLEPHAAVIVVTAKAIKSHGGVRLKDLDQTNVDAVEKGLANVEHLVGMIRSFGLPVVVAVNRFPTDSAEEVELIQTRSKAAGAVAAPESFVYEKGGEGGIELAEAVIEATRGDKPQIKYLYETGASIQDKVLSLAQNVYNAKDVSWSSSARRKLRIFEEQGWGNLPVCVAKTNLSISDKPRLKGAPSGYTFNVTDVRASIGAGFIYPISGTIVTMPGLPSNPRQLDVDSAGDVVGL